MGCRASVRRLSPAATRGWPFREVGSPTTSPVADLVADPRCRVHLQDAPERRGSSMWVPAQLAGQDKALKGHASPFSGVVVPVEARLERDGSPGDEQPPPVAGLGGRGEVAVAEGVDAVVGDASRLVRPVEQTLDLDLEVGVVALDLDEVGVGPARPQRGLMRLPPLELVGDDDGAAVVQVLCSAGEATAFGVRQEHVPAVILHRRQVRLDALAAAPVERRHVRPGLRSRRPDQALPQRGGRLDRAPPEDLRDLLREIKPASTDAVDDLAVVDTSHETPHPPVRPHPRLRPGPIPEIRHQPEVVVAGLLGVGPHRGVPVSKVVDREYELDVGQGPPVGGGDQRPMQRLQRRHRARVRATSGVVADEQKLRRAEEVSASVACGGRDPGPGPRKEEALTSPS